MAPWHTVNPTLLYVTTALLQCSTPGCIMEHVAVLFMQGANSSWCMQQSQCRLSALPHTWCWSSALVALSLSSCLSRLLSWLCSLSDSTLSECSLLSSSMV